jgi:alkanesulfonate monooxygenase SsuD/methylene tetrahydromethanopterin reductase-like flavin-dependent oxidoreductase (luciferase family)
VRLGTSVVCLPLHNPVEIAEQLAMVDLMSGGRVQLGFGRGFVVRDYEVLGVPYESAQAQMLEALQVILKAWSGRPFTHVGRFYRFEQEVTVWPQPAQKPHPPLWMAATKDPDSFAYAGGHDYNLLTVAWVKPLPQLAELVRTYRQARAAAGLDPHGRQVCTHYQVVVADDGAEARQLAQAALRQYIAISASARSQAQATSLQALASASPRGDNDVDVAALVDEARVLAGTPDEVAATLERVGAELGVDVVDCSFYFGGLPFEVARRSFELFGREVMPRFARAPAAASAG